MYKEYDFIPTNGHVEVYQNGEFCFSADTLSEAYKELDADHAA